MRTANEENREKFVNAAVKELEEHGVSDFSMRRVARRCGVSCAAPYKHFGNRSELMLEVIRSINRKWSEVQSKTLAGCGEASLREKIIAVCMAYVNFLCTYPEYQTIIFMNDRIFFSGISRRENEAQRGDAQPCRGILPLGEYAGKGKQKKDIYFAGIYLRCCCADQFRFRRTEIRNL